MTRHKAVVALAIVALTCTTAGSAFAQPPGGGPGGGPPGPPPDGAGQARGTGGGAISDMMYLERSWTAVCFQLLCSSEQLNALLEPFDQALQTRNAAIQAAVAAQDMEAVNTALSACKQAVNTALQAQLTDDQWATCQELMSYQPLGAGPGPR